MFLSSESILSHWWVTVLEMFQETRGGAGAASPTCSQLQALPRGLSSSGADEWGSAALGAPPRRVSRIPLKILQNIACVCTSVTGPCQKGAFLECLLTFSLVSTTRRPRMFIHRAAFCSRNAATSSAGMDGNSRWRLGMSLPGATSGEHRPWSSTLKAWELPEPCQELVAEPRAWAPLCQSLTDGCGLSFPAASSPGPPPSYGAQSWPGWWNFGETTGVLQCPCRPLGWEPSRLNGYQVWGIAGEGELSSGCQGPSAHPARTRPPPCLWGLLVHCGLQTRLFCGM